MTRPAPSAARSFRFEVEACRFDRVAVKRVGVLRDVVESDLPVFFEHQRDPEAIRMAAFVSRDRDAFFAHWATILSDDSLTKQTIVDDGQVAGNIVCFEQHGEPSVGYWLGREHWGKGLATKALAELLDQLETRPLYARAARDNVASIRVLEKCGFVVTSYETSFHEALGVEIEEALLELV